MATICYARPGEPVQLDENALRQIDAQFQDRTPHEAFRLYECDVELWGRDTHEALPYLAGRN